MNEEAILVRGLTRKSARLKEAQKGALKSGDLEAAGRIAEEIDRIEIGSDA